MLASKTGATGLRGRSSHSILPILRLTTLLPCLRILTGGQGGDGPHYLAGFFAGKAGGAGIGRGGNAEDHEGSRFDGECGEEVRGMGDGGIIVYKTITIIRQTGDQQNKQFTIRSPADVLF